MLSNILGGTVIYKRNSDSSRSGCSKCMDCLTYSHVHDFFFVIMNIFQQLAKTGTVYSQKVLVISKFGPQLYDSSSEQFTRLQI